MDLPVIVIGAGGHAKVLIETLQLLGREVLFATDNEPARYGTDILGVPVRGGDETIFEYPPEQVALVNGVGSVGRPSHRQSVYEDFTGKGYRFASVIHPTAIIARTAQIGPGAQIMAGAVLQTGAVLQENVLINTRTSIGHDCTIGAHVHIASGATLGGTTQVGATTHIGTGATLIQCLTIGANVLIGAGAVVIKDLPDGVKAWGVPAKVIE